MTESPPRKLDLMEALKRFSQDSELIVGLADRDETFRSLCEDYVTALIALHRFEADCAGNNAKAADYRNLVFELERDIEQFLNEVKAR